MFLDRRSLLQSAAALLVPSAAAIPRSASAKHHRAVERYIQAFTDYFQPLRPDAATEEAHERADEDRYRRDKAFTAAKNELKRLVMAHHGLNGEDGEIRLAAISMDIGDVTVVVGPEAHDGCDNPPFGCDNVLLVPRTDAVRARLDAIKTFDPHGYESEEEEERLSLPGDPRNEEPGFDPARMPANEPMPVKVERCDYGDGDDRYTQIIRTWTPQGAYDCRRCMLCKFGGLTIDQLGKSPMCFVDVWPDDAELVLYGPTPPDKEPQYSNDLVVETHWDFATGGIFPKPARLEVLVLTRRAWEADPRSKDDEWAISEGPRGTRGKLVVAARKVIGPLPWILEEPAQVEPAVTA